MQTRSPAYPGVSLGQAIVWIEKIHGKNRTNPIEREAAAKDMGYSGMTGSSTKALADLAHYGLIEKAGKGAVRVSQRSVDILYPDPESNKAAAITAAAFSPALFSVLRAHFNDGVPSENALKSYLARQQFAATAVPYVVTSYLETCRLVQQSSATESHGPASASDERSSVGASTTGTLAGESRPAPATPAAQQQQGLPSGPRREGPTIVNGERVVFVEEGGPAHYLKLIASGELDETMLEALEDYIKRQKKRLASPKVEAVN